MRHKIDSSGLDIDRRRAERDFDDNPPAFEPAQGSSEGWDMDFDDLGSSNSSSSFDSFEGLDSLRSTNDNSFAGSSNNSFNLQNFNNPLQQQQPQQQEGPKRLEDAIGEAGIKAAKVGVAGAKGFIAEFKEAIEDDFQNDLKLWFYYMAKGSLFLGIVGIMLLILSFLLNFNKDYCLSLVISAMISFAVSIVIYMWKRDTYMQASDENAEEEEPEEPSNFMDDEPVMESAPDADAFSNWDDDDQGSSDSGDDFANFNWDDDPDDDEESDEVVVQNQKSVDDALAELDSGYIPEDRYTREYLIETFCKVLPLITPNYAKMTEIYEDSDDFNIYDALIEDICERIGLPEEKTPRLESLKENLFVVQLKLSRPSGFNKEQVVADELAMAYKVDQETGRPKEGAENVYATYSTSNRSYFISIYVCMEPPVISLGDIYRTNHEKLKKYKMPYVWGVTELGEVIWSDADDIDTMIVSGIPRSGKSWKMQSFLLQLCMFNSPEEAEFYILDTKGSSSDYFHIKSSCPHFRCFRYTKDTILRELERITTVEKDKRSRLFEENGVINIKDMHRRFPSVKAPYIYIILDEMMDLLNSLNKDEQNHLWELLSSIVTKMPNLGFRLICVPHRIINENIKKTISNNIPNKVCIRATRSDIENGLDIKAKDFPYNLPNKGDMAVKSSEVNGGEPIYVHGEAITGSNEENAEIFRYVGEVWRRLLPNYEWADIDGTRTRRGSSKVVNHDFEPQEEEEKAINIFDDYPDEEVVDDASALSVDNIDSADDEDWGVEEESKEQDWGIDEDLKNFWKK